MYLTQLSYVNNTNAFLMNGRDDKKRELRSRITKFLRSRRSPKTKQYVGSIINVLEKALDNDLRKRIPPRSEAGWVRAKVLLDELVGPGKEIKNPTTFYRLVNDLSSETIIERQIKKIPEERMRTATYYRVIERYKRWWFLSREQLEEKHYKYLRCMRELTQHYVIARSLLEDLGCSNPQKKIAEEYKFLTGREPLSNFDLIPEHGPRMAYVKVNIFQVPVETKQDQYWPRIKRRMKRDLSKEE